MITPLSRILRKLMDDTKLFSRVEWVQILSNVDEKMISWWMDGDFIPTGENLRMILDVVEEHDAQAGVPKKEILKEFYDLTEKPIREVAGIPGCSGEFEHFRARRIKNLKDYITEPLMTGFLRCIRAIPLKSQEEILTKAAEMCREKLKESENKNDPA